MLHTTYYLYGQSRKCLKLRVAAIVFTEHMEMKETSVTLHCCSTLEGNYTHEIKPLRIEVGIEVKLRSQSPLKVCAWRVASQAWALATQPGPVQLA
jgi:hypothetical protein